ncbi:hypothetical protein DRO53_02735 [Candidatus Bathyarchaeota archaeon]|nr:MAG: hypothetical protein DRO53_02735 [Candidatus Bathyarchaeota archaeon]
MPLSFDIGRFLVCPGRKLCGFLVKVKELKPEILAEMAALTANHNIAILHLVFSRIQQRDAPVVALAFLDFTDSNISPEELVNQVERRFGPIVEVEIIKPKVEGFIVNTVSHNLMLGENRAIIFRDIGYRGLVLDVRKKIGSGAEAIQYYLGFEAGLEFGKKHREMGEALGIRDPVQVYRDISSSMFNCVGYGAMETVKLTMQPPYALIRVFNCFECELGKGSAKPFSHLVRGMIAGVLTELLGVEMFAKETKCIAKGDPYCEFEVTPRK